MTNTEKPYTSHLCTFMGREANLKILLPYIETALRINAVDNYWFIDMTRNRSDHELIKRESSRLNELFPGRVHLYNSEERAKIIDDGDKIKDLTGQWDTFYKFLNRFTDKDVIAKCDDDTYFIDVQTLKAAFELRWNNKAPYLMHANAINNGLTAYHQKRLNNTYPDKESEMYPIGGLTGPLFAHPEIACAHHKQFTNDMLDNRNNIEKYAIPNIHFTNRVSINFIFMLGKDRADLSKITRQDEYDTSCKYPQKHDRANMIIGGFLMAHHTYGVQEPVMEELQTHIGYEKLCKVLNDPDTHHEHKSIDTTVNITSAIKKGSNYMFKRWTNNNTHVIKDPDTNLYLRINCRDDDSTRQLFLKAHTDWTPDLKKAALFDISLDPKNPKQMLYTGSNSMLKVPHDLPNDNDRMLSFPVAFFFKGQYMHSKVLFEKQPSGNYVISPKNKPKFSLVPNDPPHPNFVEREPEKAAKMKTLIFFDKNKSHEWEIQKVEGPDVISAEIVRPDDFYKYANDETIATTHNELIPDLAPPKEWIWMVKGYVWEFINIKDDEYKIKLVADDESDMYLNGTDGEIKLTKNADVWTIKKGFLKKNKFIKHKQSGKYIMIDDNGVYLRSKKAPLAFNI